MKKIIFLFLVLVLFSINSFAEIQSEKEKLVAIFEQAVLSESVPGISVAVANKTGILWAEGFGYSDIENKVLMNKLTKLRIGSVAKVITSAALMRLYEQGKINFYADVRDLVPEWPKKHDKIILKQLTSHTSGIRHYNHASYNSAEEFLSNVQYDNTLSALNIFKNDALKFTPGSQFSYSTYAWTLISAVMEKAQKGKSFKQIVQDEVFLPLKLANTTFDDNDVLISHRQRAYSYHHGRLINSPEVNASYKYAGGGFLATPSDVVTFAMAHTRTDYLKAETLAMMFEKSTLNNGEKVSFGIGWDIGFERRLAKMQRQAEQNKALINIMQAHPNSVMHSGGSMGGTTMMILCLEHKHAVTVVKNVNGERSANTFALALKTLAVF